MNLVIMFEGCSKSVVEVVLAVVGGVIVGEARSENIEKKILSCNLTE